MCTEVYCVHNHFIKLHLCAVRPSNDLSDTCTWQCPDYILAYAPRMCDWLECPEWRYLTHEDTPGNDETVAQTTKLLPDFEVLKVELRRIEARKQTKTTINPETQELELARRKSNARTWGYQRISVLSATSYPESVSQEWESRAKRTKKRNDQLQVPLGSEMSSWLRTGFTWWARRRDEVAEKKKRKKYKMVETRSFRFDHREGQWIELGWS